MKLQLILVIFIVQWFNLWGKCLGGVHFLGVHFFKL